jgi:O-antigen/teichoic acid export membrane protein
MLSGAINFVAVVLTIRYLPPETFGILTFALTTMQLVGILSNAGLNETLMTMVSRAEAAQRPTEVAQALSIILRLRFVVSAFIVAGGLLLARPIAERLFRQPDLTFPLALGMLGACGVSLLQFSLTALQAFRKYGRHAVTVLLRHTALLGSLILLAATGHLDLTGALIVNIGAPFLAFALGLSYRSLEGLKGVGNPRALLPRIWNLSKWVIVINLCSMFFSRLEIYFLTAFASTLELGIYSAALKLCGGMFILEMAVRTVLFPEISRLADTPAMLGSFSRRCVGVLALLVGVVYGLGLLASLFIPSILGEQYAASVPIFLILLAARAGVIPLIPLGIVFYATDRTRAGAVLGIIQLVVLTGSGLVLIPRYGASGAAWTSVLVTLSALLCMLVLAWPYVTGARAPFRLRATDRV